MKTAPVSELAASQLPPWARTIAFTIASPSPAPPLARERAESASILRRRRVRANLWIGGGALVVALATGLSRADSYSVVYAGQLLGIALMFSGFAFVGKEPARQPAASSTQSRVRYSQKAKPA